MTKPKTYSRGLNEVAKENPESVWVTDEASLKEALDLADMGLVRVMTPSYYYWQPISSKDTVEALCRQAMDRGLSCTVTFAGTVDSSVLEAISVAKNDNRRFGKGK